MTVNAYVGGLIDVHCHLTGDDYEAEGGVDEVVKRAKAAGVSRMICSGFDLASSKEAAALSERFEEVYFCAGFHPSELGKYREGDLGEIEALCAHPKCVAVGEIGLDYHFDDNPSRQTQKEFFLKQLSIADELGLPVVIHSRDAAQDTLELLRKNAGLLKMGGLMHCYSYSPEMVEGFEKLGLYFSFGGPCTFKNARKAVESAALVSAERILTETDCPYLTPVPHRGEFPNQPKNVAFVAEKLAEVRGVELETFKTQVFENAKKLFFKVK